MKDRLLSAIESLQYWLGSHNYVNEQTNYEIHRSLDRLREYIRLEEDN